MIYTYQGNFLKTEKLSVADNSLFRTLLILSHNIDERLKMSRYATTHTEAFVALRLYN